ncbi:hypothetical protein VNO77_13779 [Canavalia gladiata]|uniref:Helicase C-terminal domain-containing protein n=1 Tax=Canavalia gladiata TaxID=3824 RepID=A0AAN9M2T6_CANGL
MMQYGGGVKEMEGDTVPVTRQFLPFYFREPTYTTSDLLPKVLVLAPTRDLAKQVEKEIKESAPYLKTLCVYGGVSYVKQQSALSCGVWNAWFMERVGRLLFSHTKKDADEVSLTLTSRIASEALHSDISQHQRERTLNGFWQGKFTVLVATEVAARGLDIQNVDLDFSSPKSLRYTFESYRFLCSGQNVELLSVCNILRSLLALDCSLQVIHYEPPNDSETFVIILVVLGMQEKRAANLILLVHQLWKRFWSRLLSKLLHHSIEFILSLLSFFTATAQKLIEEQGASALAAVLAQLSGLSGSPSSRSLINLEQVWITLQLTQDLDTSRFSFQQDLSLGFFLMFILQLLMKFKELFLIFQRTLLKSYSRRTCHLETLFPIAKLPPLHDDEPPNDFYGKFSDRDQSNRRGSRDHRGFRSSRRWEGGQF